MKFKDYYETLGVERDASADEIKRAYRRLARRFHPDVSKQSDAEARFKEVGEAYKVLKDPETRAAYDQLGANYQAGQSFTPPPDWDAGFEFRGPGGGMGSQEDVSDFFEALFGGMGRSTRSREGGFAQRGEDHHAKVMIDLEDAYQGATRRVTLRVPEVDANGHVATRERSLDVKIPKGVKAGQHIRLAGLGTPGIGSAPAGDLFLEVAFRGHSRYRVEGRDVFMELPVAPWEAAMGAKVKVPTPAGPVEMSVPAGSNGGRKLRLAGRGIPGKEPGDFYVTLRIALPPAKDEASRALYRQMRDTMAFDPRSALEGA
ncbi:MAG: DnaJ domain-containing protein [Xanthomonadales bacterium]|nr:DnaJ domain-containing protein [Xanthomonadales bacterium]